MPSPFPGMNPFLEQNDTWEDFHQDFITRAREMLTAQVGGNYTVAVGEPTDGMHKWK
jgi:enoyl reductase-like protein